MTYYYLVVGNFPDFHFRRNSLAFSFVYSSEKDGQSMNSTLENKAIFPPDAVSHLCLKGSQGIVKRGLYFLHKIATQFLCVFHPVKAEPGFSSFFTS